MTNRNWRMLLVEDDPDGQEVVATILAHLNIPLDIAGDADAAEQLLFGGRRYTAVIIDLALPGKDGWALLSDIQQHPDTASLPCIAITAYHNPRVRDQAIQAGFVAYFAKPIDSTQFMRRLESIV